MRISDLSSDVCSSDLLLRLRRIRNDDAADVLRRRTSDDDFVVEIDRAGQLGKGGRGKQRDRNQRDAGGKRVTKFHVRMSPWWLAVGRSVLPARGNLARPVWQSVVEGKWGPVSVILGGRRDI